MRSVLVIDTETTGLDAGTDGVVEIAGVRIEDGEIVYSRQSVVDPGRPIPAQASAIHHLTDRDVVGARKLDEAISYIGVRQDDVIVAHNADFDRKFLPVLSTQSWVCTWKCANKIYPDAPSFGNQVLRYFLGLDVDSGNGRDGQPHSAGYDARTTANIFINLLNRITIEEMIEISKLPVLLNKIPFGKYKGMGFTEAPKDYLMWLDRQPHINQDLSYTIKHYI